MNTNSTPRQLILNTNSIPTHIHKYMFSISTPLFINDGLIPTQLEWILVQYQPNH